MTSEGDEMSDGNIEIFGVDSKPDSIDASEELKDCFTKYSLSVNRHRALPDVRDGLKLVHRRIIYAMGEAGLVSSRAYKKSAWAAGEVMAKYHPHGDGSIYDSMVRMAQDFSLRYPLIDGHGNFGSEDGSPAAAPRYTEARLATIADEMLDGVRKDTVDWWPNYDETLVEPRVLPSRFPNLIVNGSEGIAMAYRASLQPHNLREVVRALCVLLDNPKATLPDIRKHVKGPDYPTGGIIIGKDGIDTLYETGKGTIVIRGKFHVEEHGGTKSIVITELPYRTKRGTKTVIQGILAITKDGGEDGEYLANAISGKPVDMTSLEAGTRLVIDLKRDASVARVVGILINRNTGLQSQAFASNVCLVNGVPQTLGLMDLMREYISFQIEVTHRNAVFDLAAIEARLHVLEGFLKALGTAQDIDRVVKESRSSTDKEEQISRLMRAFKVTETQADAVVMLRLTNLSKIDIGKTRKEHMEKTAEKKRLQGLIKSDAKKREAIKENLERIAATYGDARRTAIVTKDDIASGDFSEEKVAAASNESNAIVVTCAGYAKRMALPSRPGASAPLMAVDPGDRVCVAATTTTSAETWVLTGDGNVSFVPVSDIPLQDKSGRGRSLSQIVTGGDPETRAMMASAAGLRGDDKATVLVTSQLGLVRRSLASEYASARSTIAGHKEKPGDRTVGIRQVSDDDMVLLVSTDGMAAHFQAVGKGEPEIPLQGRTASGVAGLLVSGSATCLPASAYPSAATKDGYALILTEMGFGRMVALSDLSVTKRRVKGIRALPVDVAKHGRTAIVIPVAKAERKTGTVTLVTAGGTALRVPLADIPTGNRTTRLARVVEVPEGDTLATAMEEG